MNAMPNCWWWVSASAKPGNSKHFGLSKLQKLEAVGSDHFPMLADICLEEQADHSQNQEPADREDKKEVEEKIQEGK